MTLFTQDIPLELIEDVAAEVRRARAKFPAHEDLTVALFEEAGEVAKSQLQCAPHEVIRKELVQVIAVCVRIITEGDATMERRRTEKNIAERAQK